MVFIGDQVLGKEINKTQSSNKLVPLSNAFSTRSLCSYYCIMLLILRIHPSLAQRRRTTRRNKFPSRRLSHVPPRTQSTTRIHRLFPSPSFQHATPHRLRKQFPHRSRSRFLCSRIRSPSKSHCRFIPSPPFSCRSLSHSTAGLRVSMSVHVRGIRSMEYGHGGRRKRFPCGTNSLSISLASNESCHPRCLRCEKGRQFNGRHAIDCGYLGIIRPESESCCPRSNGQDETGYPGEEFRCFC